MITKFICTETKEEVAFSNTVLFEIDYIRDLVHRSNADIYYERGRVRIILISNSYSFYNLINQIVSYKSSINMIDSANPQKWAYISISGNIRGDIKLKISNPKIIADVRRIVKKYNGKCSNRIFQFEHAEDALNFLTEFNKSFAN